MTETASTVTKHADQKSTKIISFNVFYSYQIEHKFKTQNITKLKTSGNFVIKI